MVHNHADVAPLPPGVPDEHDQPVTVPNGAALPFKVGDGVKAFHLVADEVDHAFDTGLHEGTGALAPAEEVAARSPATALLQRYELAKEASCCKENERVDRRPERQDKRDRRETRARPRDDCCPLTSSAVTASRPITAGAAPRPNARSNGCRRYRRTAGLGPRAPKGWRRPPRLRRAPAEPRYLVAHERGHDQNGTRA